MSRKYRKRKLVNASTLGSFAYCEKAALYSHRGVEPGKAARDRMAAGERQHVRIAGIADEVVRREATNAGLLKAAAVIVCVILALAAMGRI